MADPGDPEDTSFEFTSHRGAQHCGVLDRPPIISRLLEGGVDATVFLFHSISKFLLCPAPRLLSVWCSSSDWSFISHLELPRHCREVIYVAHRAVAGGAFLLLRSRLFLNVF